MNAVLQMATQQPNNPIARGLLQAGYVVHRAEPPTSMSELRMPPPPPAGKPPPESRVEKREIDGDDRASARGGDARGSQDGPPAKKRWSSHHDRQWGFSQPDYHKKEEMTCDCCEKKGITNVSLWACNYQCRIANLGDSSDTRGYAYFCDQCWDREAHGCWDRLDIKKKYQIDHGKETRERRRSEEYLEGNNRYDSRENPNVMIGKHVSRLIGNVMRLKDHHLRYCNMNEKSRKATAGLRIKAAMDRFLEDTMDMHNLIPRDYADGVQRAKDDPH
ncbi:MAG: hypothetical protein QF382_03240, partial [Acidimicrobiales bacterium]|nr:hypothetical protein [Acidimicrobiales bacterium]